MQDFNFGICGSCVHFEGELDRPGAPTCPAYPEMIPAEVLDGDVIHLEVLDDQEGDIVWEPDEGVDPELGERMRAAQNEMTAELVGDPGVGEHPNDLTGGPADPDEDLEEVPF